jgi:hypothetical protein
MIPVFVYVHNFTEDHRRILLLPKDVADRRAYLPGRQHRGRHLVEQRLKQVMIHAVSQDDFRRSSFEGPGCG